jgi:hypothetical protein
MPDAACDCAVVCVGEDQVGAFPAQFERDTFQGFGGGEGDCFAGSCGPRE